MIVDKLLPITFTGWDILNKANDFIFYGVHFNKQFGPWSDNEFCGTIRFLLSEGKIEELTQDGRVLKFANIDIVVKQPEAPTEATELLV